MCYEVSNNYFYFISCRNPFLIFWFPYGRKRHYGKSRQAAFIPNKGQWDDEARFLTRTGCMDAWITDNGIVFDFSLSTVKRTGRINQAGKGI